jgi:phospholipase C
MGLEAIEHVVVLMLENRSFDHMLGYLYHDADPVNVSPSGHPFEGLTGSESNLSPTGSEVAVFQIAASDQNAYWYPLCPPGEGYAHTNQQLFGTQVAPVPPVATNVGFVTDFADALAHPLDPPLEGAAVSTIMGMYTPSLLPILSGLATGYAVCDEWFASVPTETMPNRAFALAGTSLGRVTDTSSYFDTPSIFGSLSRAGVTWKIYGYTKQPLTQMDFPDTRSAPAANFGVFSDFQADASNGHLPAFSFLEPEWSSGGPSLENDQHPISDMANGEKLIYDTYQALKSSPTWAQTLLIVTYDEHGGCYDHVAPPVGAVAPDQSPGEDGFDFTRFGLRVPTVLVSPLIQAGTVFRAPDGSPPFDHTSILATVEKLWGLDPLTHRDAAAVDISSVLSLAEPRSDDPLRGVTPPAYSPPGGARSSSVVNQPSRVLAFHALMAAELPIAGDPSDPSTALSHLHTAEDYSQFIHDRLARWNEAKPLKS